MNKKGSALILGLLLILVLSALSASFYSKSLNENILIRRQTESTRALWLAEAGLATAISRLPSTASEIGMTLSDGNSNYTYSTNTTQVYNGTYNVYKISSTGTVTLPSITLSGQHEKVSRNVQAYIKSGETPNANFGFAIETTGKIKTFGAAVHIDSRKEDSNFSLETRFGLTGDQLRDAAIAGNRYYTPDDFGSPPVDGITWVEAPSGWHQSGNLYGSGILIVNGDARFGGTVDFDGIIYVIGQLTIVGTVQVRGSILAECGADVTDVKGTVDLLYNLANITAALNLDAIKLAKRTVVSWREF